MVIRRAIELSDRASLAGTGYKDIALIIALLLTPGVQPGDSES